jgi:hypothetical protein
VTEAPKSEPTLTPAGQKAKAERDARQAAALRANLRRRKAQERGREALEEAPPSAAEGNESRESGGAHSLYPDISD